MPSRRRIHSQRVWLRLATLAALALLALGVRGATLRIEALAASPYPMACTPRFRPALPVSASPAARPAGLAGLERLPVETAFRPGDTLGSVLGELGLEAADAQALAVELSRHADPRKLRPADRYGVLAGDDGGLEEFRLILAGRGRVAARRSGASWKATWRPFERSVESRTVSGRLEGSLDLSIQRQGGEGVLAYMLADVLQWDLDFNRDLRAGDGFEILYERVFLDGEADSVGDILAARYRNGGRELEAYRFGADGHYYDAEGRPLRKLFLRSPMRYSRVTSRFSSRRFHPVLKRYRPHYGVDYGAPRGTPVRATASGRVAFAGWDGGGGRTIKIRHPNGYLTAYLHLSGFARGMGAGKRVVQGEVIGYVGATGLATAPHLDYRIQRDGRWINPLSLKSAPAEPLPADQLPDFLQRRDALRVAMNAGREPRSLATVPAAWRMAFARDVEPPVTGDRAR